MHLHRLTRIPQRGTTLLLVAAAAVVMTAGVVVAAFSSSTPRVGTVAARPSPSPASAHPQPSAPPGTIAWGPLAAAHQSAAPMFASTNPPLTVPVDTPACRSLQLAAVAQYPAEATGNSAVPVLFRNRSSSACELQGFPGVAVVGTAGQVLASATGTANRGTFFDIWPSMPVLLAANTPSLPPPPSTPPPEQAGAPGQTVLNIAWYDCHQPQAIGLIVDLPGAGGRLRVAFHERGAASPACGPPGIAAVLTRGSFAPTGASPPEAVYVDVLVRLITPASVRAGSTLVYYVTLTNVDSVMYTLMPCPDYSEFLSEKEPFMTFQVNCAPAAPLAPGGSLSFEMRLMLPSSTHVGLNQLTWALDDGRLTNPTATASINVTPA